LRAAIEEYPVTWGPGFLRFTTSLAFLEAIAVVAGLDDFASMCEPIKQRGPYTLAAGTPNMQPVATSVEFIKRIAHAMDDLNSLSEY
jgi:hypothetical protein